jgi:hypothetical protein
LGYEFTKNIWTGIVLIIAGYLFTVAQNLYDLGRQAVIFLPLQIAIPTVLTTIGFGVILYDFWSKCKKRVESDEPKEGRKRRWRYFPKIFYFF